MKTVKKIFKFDSAHRLYRYEGKCANLHGHTYVAEVELTGNQINELGILVDFGDIKKKIGKWIDENWDHATLLNSEDTLYVDLDTEENKTYTFSGENPTAEVMCIELYTICEESFPGQVHKVTIWETPTSCATYSEAVSETV